MHLYLIHKHRPKYFMLFSSFEKEPEIARLSTLDSLPEDSFPPQ